MTRTIYLLLCLALVFASCKDNTTTKGNNGTSTTTTTQPAAPHNDWYKRYTGTVAGQPVVVNIYHYGDNEIKGTYCYDKKGVILELNSDRDSCSGNNYFVYESSPAERNDSNDYHNNPRWKVVIDNNTIKGNWVSKDGTKSYPIELKEDYSGGAYQFGMMTHDDSVKIKHGTINVGATSAYIWPVPAAATKPDDAAFITTALLHQMGGATTSAKDINEAIGMADDAYFKEYKETVDSAGDVDNDAAFSLNYETSEKAWVIYNQPDMLVFEFDGYIYSGGAHGMYGSTFVTVDMQQKKVWKLDEIMNTDSTKLVPIIEQEVRRTFGIPQDSALSTVLLVDTIHVTDNFYYTHTGIVFNYSPYEIASFADGEVNLFLPFTRLMSLLTPEFKQRMKL